MEQQKGASAIFEQYLQHSPLFVNKKVLQTNYTPETIPHREMQISQIAKILAPALHHHKPSNLFVYGKTGTGKTLTILHTTNALSQHAAQQQVPLKIIYLNCKLKKIADTEYRLIAQIIREYGKDIPVTGLPTDEVYHTFYRLLESKKHLLILILDEIDQLVKKAGDEILYNLTRINSELKETQVSLLGISNNLIFADDLDPRVKSSLSEEELVFPPYNALQIQDILRSRAQQAFKEGALEAGVIEKCAAYAAREHGDARRALDLLRVAGEVAERSSSGTVFIKHIDEAEDKIERDRILDVILAQPKQFQAALYAILQICEKKKGILFTGEIYDVYQQFCADIGLRPLTQRRVSDIIAELDMLGIISAKVTSKGRYGRTREIRIALPPAIIIKIKKLVEKDLDIKAQDS
ncbi:ORC1-type DNA replication protein, partial [Candidatus Woesearchaeota archaeon]|nr:ORC1-type DNA replication protein [Candidatus Woesearchaeota archaeon]